MNGANLQTVTWFAHLVKSGKINLSTDKEELLQLSVKDHQIDLNIVETKFLKDLMKDNNKKTSFREVLKKLKTLAQELKNQETSITISHKGETLLTLGSDARPHLSQLLTGSKEIEINNLQKLIQTIFF